MNSWYDNIILHPKTHKVLLPYRGEFPCEQVFKALVDCIICENEDLVCYDYCDVKSPYPKVLVINKNSPFGYIIWNKTLLGNFSNENGIIYLSGTSGGNTYEVCLSNMGIPILIPISHRSYFDLSNIS